MVDKQEIWGYILGEITLEFLIAFYFFALFGVILSMLLHYGKKSKNDKKRGNKKPFSLKYWFKDNIVRLLTSIFCIFMVVRFYDSLPITYELNMFLGVIVGGSLDQVIVLIRNKTNIDIFQTKS